MGSDCFAQEFSSSKCIVKLTVLYMASSASTLFIVAIILVVCCEVDCRSSRRNLMPKASRTGTHFVVALRQVSKIMRVKTAIVNLIISEILTSWKISSGKFQIRHHHYIANFWAELIWPPWPLLLIWAFPVFIYFLAGFISFTLFFFFCFEIE